MYGRLTTEMIERNPDASINGMDFTYRFLVNASVLSISLARLLASPAAPSLWKAESSCRSMFAWAVRRAT
jgi:hypothetical protein